MDVCLKICENPDLTLPNLTCGFPNLKKVSQGEDRFLYKESIYLIFADFLFQDIAKTRHSVPGVGLISPPPHHDIYSIEARAYQHTMTISIISDVDPDP